MIINNKMMNIHVSVCSSYELEVMSKKNNRELLCVCLCSLCVFFAFIAHTNKFKAVDESFLQGSSSCLEK